MSRHDKENYLVKGKEDDFILDGFETRPVTVKIPRKEIEIRVTNGDVSIYSMLEGLEAEFIRLAKQDRPELPSDEKIYLDIKEGYWCWYDWNRSLVKGPTANEHEIEFFKSLQSISGIFYQMRLDHGYEPPELY